MKNTDSSLTPAQKAAVILALTERVQSECSIIDMEQRFRDSLDSCYPVVTVGGLEFAPSRVMEGLDLVAFRCGVADSSDHENVVEIEGEYYDCDKVDEARDEFAADLQTELRGEQEELDSLELNEGVDPDDVAFVRAAVALTEAKIELAESHSF